MPRRIAPLTSPQVKNAKPQSKDYKLYDGRGLFLVITVSGGKLWRFKYRFAGREKELSVGAYPEVSLEDARELRESARKLVAKGIDPGEEKKRQKAAEKALEQIDVNTFEKIAREWHTNKKPEWSEKHSERLLRSLELDIFPDIGSKPILEIETPDLVKLLQRVALRTIETAKRLKIALHGTFRHALQNGYIKHNPASDFRGVLPTVKSKHMAAPTEPKKVAQLLRAIDGFEGTLVVKYALQLSPLLFVRPGELRSAEWSEVDLEAAEWNIPAEKMKMKRPHLVPLSCQVVEILKNLHTLTGHGRFLFPSQRSPLCCISDNTINASLRRLGFDKSEITAHGFRAMARTMLHEILKFTPDAIEAQLAHAVPDRLGRAYNRTLHLEERKRMMQVWADYLDGLKLISNK